MSNLNTELMETLLKNDSLDEFFRSHLEKAINDLLQNETHRIPWLRKA